MNHPLAEMIPTLNQVTKHLELDLTGRDLDSIPPRVLQFTELEALKLSFNRLKTLPPDIAQLSKLKHLWLDFNEFKEFPEVVCELTSLEHLYLSQNKLGNVSPKIGQLRSLEKLLLHKNDLTELPNELFHIPSLLDLHISENKLTELSKDVGCLENLTMLRCYNNKIMYLPDSICRLKKLTYFDIAMNQLQELPGGFGTALGGVDDLNLFGNPFVQPPFEVCSQGVRAIEDYQDQIGTAKESIDPCLKMVLVGETCAGKTSLKNALVLNKSQLVDVLCRTHGIDVTTWDTGQKIKINIYDFGGHEAYFLTHQLFLTISALHLLVVNLSTYSEDNFHRDVGRWLDMLTVRVPGAVVRVIGTHTDIMSMDEVEATCSLISHQIATYQKKRDASLQEMVNKLEHRLAVIDTNNVENCILQELHARLEKANKAAHQTRQIGQYVIPVSSAIGLEGILALKEEIVSMAGDSKYFPELKKVIPPNWVALEKLLRAKSKEADCPLYITLEDCVEMGKSAGLQNQSSLGYSLNYLHRTGGVLYYEALPQIAFPNPAHLIDIFTVLLKDHAEIKAEYFKMSWLTKLRLEKIDDSFTHQAILPHSVILALLRQHTGQGKKGLDLLLTLMCNFGICHLLPTPEQDSLAKAYDTFDRMYHFPWYLRKSKPTDLHWQDSPQEDEQHIEIVCEMAMPSPWGLFERWCVLSTRHLSYRQAWENGMYAFSRVDMSVAIMMQHVEEDRGSSLHVAGRGTKDKLITVWTTVKSIVSELQSLLKEWPGLYTDSVILCAHCVKNGAENPGYFSGEPLHYPAPQGTTSLRCPRTGEMVDVRLVYPPASPTNQPISEDCVQHVSCYLSKTTWRPLARVLGVENAVIEEIEEGHHAGLREMKYRMLRHWQRKAGRLATLAALISGLRHFAIEENGLADDLEKMTIK